jgi:Polyketide cyclase / dehydrase and lipid transport
VVPGTAPFRVKTTVDVEVSTVVERSAGEVWAMVSDATRLPEWLAEFKEVGKESDGAIGEGAVSRYTLGPGPGERSGLLSWVEWDPPRRLAWDGPPLCRASAAPGRAGHSRFSNSPRIGARFVSRCRPELSGGLMLLRPMLARWLKRQRRSDTQRLKTILEARPATAHADPS